MPVPNETPISYRTGNGSSTSFSFDWSYTNAAHVKATVSGAVVPYSVAGNVVTFTSAPAASAPIVIYRETPRERTTDYQNAGDLLAETLDQDVDNLQRQLQEVESGAGGVSSAVRAPSGEILPELGSAALRANRILAFDASGNPLLIVGVDAGSAAALALDLAASGGSALIGFLQAGAGASARTLQARGRETIRSSDFSGDAFTRCTAAIAEAKTRAAPHIVIEPGTLALGDNTLVFDVPNGTTIDFLGTFTSTAAGKSAVQIGKASANTWAVTWRGLKVTRTSNDYAGTSVGVELLNLAACTGDIRQTTGFRIGVMPHGNGYGCVYNKVSLGQLHDNRDNFLIRVTNPAGGGYCNENLFLDGSFNHSTGYDVVTYNGRNIVIEYNATNQPNNNIFLGPSLEDAHPSSSNTVAAEIAGANNILVHPRVERIFSPSTYLIKFTVNATECGIVNDGFSLLNSNIEDLGTNTKFATREGQFLSYQTAAGTGKAVLTLMSTTSSDARLLRLLDSAKTERAYLTGAGLIYARNLSLDNLGSYANEAAAIAAGVPLHGLYYNSTIGGISQRRTP